MIKTTGKGRPSAGTLRFFAALLRNRNGIMKECPRVYEPRSAELTIPAGQGLHARPVAAIDDQTGERVFLVFWADGVEFRFKDGAKFRASFDEMYFEALARASEEEFGYCNDG